ncbi:hypothetical protein ACHQM5_026791 [Ranunculus cassubicifolius]
MGSNGVVVEEMKNTSCSNYSRHQGEKDHLYAELWQACAGPSVRVPTLGEKVYYFPQGHLEQIEAYTKQETNVQMPKYDLPWKILCTVVNVQLMAEVDTDEVFAQMTLLPEKEQIEPSMEKDGLHSQADKSRVYAFSKTLTPSDTSTHGGFSVFKKHADECLPPLDMSQQPPSQDLVAKDLHGFEWRFRHIFRGQPKRHLITTGWSTFVSSKKLVAGDTLIFLRGENRELRVGIRRARKSQNNASPSVLSNHSMQLGVLASASHAISTGSMFSVYYRPRTSPSEFIVPYTQYIRSSENDYAVGQKFRMKFECDEFPERRLSGTVLGIEDIDSLRWPDSKWRCLKVRWDEALTTVAHPTRVSPWKLEPLSNLKMSQSSHLPQPKKARIRLLPSSPESSLLANEDLLQSAIKPSLQFRRQSRVLQGQEDSGIVSHNQPLPHLVTPPNISWSQLQLELENEFHCQIHDAYPPYFQSSTPSPHVIQSVSGNTTYCLPPLPTIGNDGEDELQNWFGPNTPNTLFEVEKLVHTSTAQLKTGSSCRIFGIDLVGSSLEPAPTAHDLKPSEEDCKTNPFTTRSCTKIHKYGVALGRSIDLTRFNGYDELIVELDHMFDFDGGLKNDSNGWSVLYTDDDVDNTKLIGDAPWQKFQSMVQKMYICPKEEVDKLCSPKFTVM